MPTHPGRAIHSVTVPHEGQGVSLARHAFAVELATAGISDEVRQDALLVMSELVSNAVKHGQPLPGGEVRVCWTIDDECLRIKITDGGAVTRPNPAVATAFALGGRGLDIVRMISHAWGITQEGESVTVWADIPRVRKQLAGRRFDVPRH